MTRTSVPTAIVFSGKISAVMGTLTENHDISRAVIFGEPTDEVVKDPAFRAYADQLREAYEEIQALGEVPYIITVNIAHSEDDDWMDADLAHELQGNGVRLALVLPGDTA